VKLRKRNKKAITWYMSVIVHVLSKWKWSIWSVMLHYLEPVWRGCNPSLCCRVLNTVSGAWDYKDVFTDISGTLNILWAFWYFNEPSNLHPFLCIVCRTFKRAACVRWSELTSHQHAQTKKKNLKIFNTVWRVCQDMSMEANQNSLSLPVIA
jgi:hypothetical protein